MSKQTNKQLIYYVTDAKMWFKFVEMIFLMKCDWNLKTISIVQSYAPLNKIGKCTQILGVLKVMP